MNEWNELRQLKMERCTVTIYRSNAAMRKWMVEAVFKNGWDPSKLIYEDEGDAWRRYYAAAGAALAFEAEPWKK